MKKTVKLSNGTSVKLTIIKEFDGSKTILTDREITEEEAEEIAELV